MMTATNTTNLIVPDESRLDVIPKLLVCDLFSPEETVVLKGLEDVATLCFNVDRHETLKLMAPDATTKEEMMEYKKAVALQDNMEMSHRATVRDFGGHLALVVIMKQWWSSPNIQVAACKAMYYASYPSAQDPSTEAYQDLAVHVGAMEMIINSLQMYKNIEDVQLWGIRALLHLGWCERNYVPLVLEKQHGITVFLDAMNTFPLSKDIQRTACIFLQKIIHASSEIRELIVNAGGRRVLLAAIENHPESNEYSSVSDDMDSIQRNARETMKVLCEPIEPKQQQRSPTNTKSIRDPANQNDDSGKGIGGLFKKINLF